MSEGSYTSSITVLTGLDSVRKRPGMYFGSTSAAGIEYMVGEFASNAADQFLAGRATAIAVRLDDARIVIEDDGSGLPFDEAGPEGSESLATHYLTTLHAQPTADEHAPHVHIHGFHGVGLAAVNAVSATLRCEAWRGGHLWAQEFSRGVPTGAPEVVATGHGQGTTISFVPDPEVWGSTRPRPAAIRAQLFLMAHLIPGLHVRFGEEHFHSLRGLEDLALIELQVTASHIWPWRSRPVFSHRVRTGDLDIAVAFVGDADESGTRWRTWVNGSETPGHGSHQDGLRDALQEADWAPALAMAHLIMHAPKFAGPTRDRLDVPEVAAPIQAAVQEAILRYCEAHDVRRGHR